MKKSIIFDYKLQSKLTARCRHKLSVVIFYQVCKFTKAIITVGDKVCDKCQNKRTRRSKLKLSKFSLRI